MLGEFGDEMDQTSSRMDSVLKKLEKVSHMTSSKYTHTHTHSGNKLTGAGGKIASRSSCNAPVCMNKASQNQLKLTKMPPQ